MSAPKAEPLSLEVDEKRRVSALLIAPSGARACYVLAHGAGVGMKHRAMEETAVGLAKRGIATFRFQFPYMEQGSKRPDRPALCHATIRAAVAETSRRLPKLPLVAGGRSFGGRMTSQAEAASHLPDLRGLAFLGFPLHPAGRSSVERAAHLSDVRIPMLFLQGTRDALADLTLLEPLIARLPAATLKLFEDADHSFHVPARTGRTDADVREDVLDMLAGWIGSVTGEPAALKKPRPKTKTPG